MHGRAQNYSKSRGSFRRISSQHMLSVLLLATSGYTVAVTGDSHCSLPSPVSTASASEWFFKERQEEVDRLLYKTRSRMHATLQSDGRSPKQVKNSPKSASQLKPASDSGQNSGTFLSQVKGKKRERVEHGSDYVKRGRSSRTDGGDFLLHHKSVSNLKSVIAQITENGGLVDLEGVDKLVQLMQPDRMERKMELVSRSMLAGVMAATDKVDCLNRFVQLRGLPILDGWLQDIHKGKVGDGNNNKFVEELLLVLLCALDKLPVNLHALQMCNIGRSVNHLRSHKNLEIQRKARSLVDTWKKRVEAEMVSIDAKSRQPETSHGGSRTTPSGSDVAIKSSISENSAAIKTTPVSASSHGENNNMKSATSSPGSGKSASSGVADKDSQPLIKEDRSSSSNSQSHNRKSTGFSKSNAGNKKETISQRSSSAHRITALDKFSQSCERVLEGEPATEGGVHKLVVKIPNRVHSPSAPAQDKSDVNVGSLQKCESKNVVTGSEDGVGLSAAPDEEHRTPIEDVRRSVHDSPSNQRTPKKLHASSFSPMNALAESCAKYSEANSSMLLEDDVGMNLLASVAAGEVSISNMMMSPADSTERSTPAIEEVCDGNEAKSKCTPEPEDKQAAVDGLNISKHETIDVPGGGHDSWFGSSYKYFRNETDSAMEVNGNKSDDKSTPLVLPISGEKVRDGKSNEVCNVSRDCISNCKSDGFCATIAEKRTSTDLLNDKDKLTAEVSASHQSSDGDFQSELNEELNMGTSSLQKLTSVAKDEVAEPTACGQVEVGGGVSIGEPIEKHHLKGCTKKFDGVNTDTKLNRSDSQCKEDCSSTSDEIKSYQKEETIKDEDISVPRKGSLGSVYNEADEKGSPCNQLDAAIESAAKASSSAAEASDMDSKVKFDLNEGFSVDEDKYGDSVDPLSSVPTTDHLINSSSFPATSIPNNHSASITVAAPAKGPFVPPDNLLRNKAEIGWKGSAATSAFRPAEPRKFSESPLVSSSMSPDASTSKRGRVPLDIDLNVPDERVLEEIADRESTNGAHCSVPVRSPGWLDFNLNTVVEANDVGQCSTSSNHKGVDIRRGFDLNNGPGLDDNSTEHFQIIQQMKEGIPLPPHLSSATSLTMNRPGFGNLSSWFLPGTTYSTVASPSVLTADRGEQQRFPVFPSGVPQRPFGSPSGANPFIPDIYRGSVLSSSPTMTLQPGPFQFSVFPFGDTFPLPSATFPVGATSSHRDTITGPRFFAPPVTPQFQGAVPSQFQGPFMVNLPDNRSNDGLGNRGMWGRQDLDLNSGPGTMESEVREQMLSGQHSIVGSQALAEEKSSRMYSVSGATLKRKDPDGGQENDNFRYKQSPYLASHQSCVVNPVSYHANSRTNIDWLTFERTGG